MVKMTLEIDQSNWEKYKSSFKPETSLISPALN